MNKYVYTNIPKSRHILPSVNAYFFVSGPTVVVDSLSVYKVAYVCIIIIIKP